jgi:hypothetical protein
MDPADAPELACRDSRQFQRDASQARGALDHRRDRDRMPSPFRRIENYLRAALGFCARMRIKHSFYGVTNHPAWGEVPSLGWPASSFVVH